jgi:hypothetical protein
LILWNHGGGWAPSAIDTISTEVKTKNYGRAEGAERSASPLGRVFFRTTMKKIMSLETMEERAIASDDGSGHSVDTSELGKVMQLTKAALEKDLDLLGMDACLMSNFEVAYQVRDHVNYIVASEENEPFDGWPYDLVLEKLVQNPDIPTTDFCAHIVDAYIESYKTKHYTVTQSAFDLAKVNDLAQTLDQLADALIKHMPAARFEIWNAQNTAAKFWHNTLWDIAHFCKILELGTTSTDVKAACQAVLGALTPGPGNFVIAESHRGKKVDECGGVTIYFNPPPNGISKFYADLNYAENHHWDEMLLDYHTF